MASFMKRHEAVIAFKQGADLFVGRSRRSWSFSHGHLAFW